MNAKMIGAAIVVGSALALPLAACGSSAPAPVATTSLKPLSPDFQKSYCGINSSTKTACEQHATAMQQQQYAAAHPTSKDDGLPWWAWLLIVPSAGIGLLVLWVKLSEMNDERRVAKAWQKVDELDARAARRATRVLDYDDYADDDELDDEADELPEEDMDFLHKVTDPAPAPAPSAPPASGGLLSSLRQQNQ